MKESILNVYKKPYYRISINLLLLFLGLVPLLFSGSGLDLVLPGNNQVALKSIYRSFGSLAWTDFGSAHFYILLTISLWFCSKNKKTLKPNLLDLTVFCLSIIPLGFFYLAMGGYLLLSLAFYNGMPT